MSSPATFDEIARPTLVLGLVGFSPAAAQKVRERVNGIPVGGVQWRLGNFSEADAWLVNGERTRVIAEDEVLVESDAPGEAGVRFWLPQVDRPIAFSRPTEDFEPAYAFELDCPSSLPVLLTKFAHLLRPRAMLLYLADLLAQNAPRLRRSRVYHLMSSHRLVAVVDLLGQSGVLPAVSLRELAEAAWVCRPDSAAYLPDSFARRDTRELMWEFASRSRRQLLPRRYKGVPLLLRKTPVLPQRLFTDTQLFALRELAKGPRSFEQLCASAGFGDTEVERALSALYLVGAIANPEKARRRREEAPSRWPWMNSEQVAAALKAEMSAPGALAPH